MDALPSLLCSLVFEGSRNTLAALRMAMENRFFEGSFNDCGIYVLTTGIPDQVVKRERKRLDAS